MPKHESNPHDQEYSWFWHTLVLPLKSVSWKAGYIHRHQHKQSEELDCYQVVNW